VVRDKCTSHGSEAPSGDKAERARYVHSVFLSNAKDLAWIGTQFSLAAHLRSAIMSISEPTFTQVVPLRVL